jgi:hypothetical protein
MLVITPILTPDKKFLKQKLTSYIWNPPTVSSNFSNIFVLSIAIKTPSTTTTSWISLPNGLEYFDSHFVPPLS